MKEKLLGIDPGTSDYNCSWALLCEGKLEKFGTIDLKKIRHFPKKLDVIAQRICDILEVNNVTCIACETYFANFGKATGIVRIPELRGVLQYLSSIYNLKWVDVHPSQMKKLIAGKGNATKDDVMKSVRKRCRLRKNIQVNSHEGDAIGIALAAYELSKS